MLHTVVIVKMPIVQHIEHASLPYVKKSEIIPRELISRWTGPRICDFNYEKSATLQDYSVTPESLVVRCFDC